MHLQLRLLSAQVLLDEGDVKGATKIVETLTLIKDEAGTVATLIAMHKKGGDHDKAAALLNDKLTKGQDNAAGDGGDVRIAKGEHDLKAGMYEAAAATFKAVLAAGRGGGAGPGGKVGVGGGTAAALSPLDKARVTALLVVALSHFDVDEAEMYANGLPTVTSAAPAGGGGGAQGADGEERDLDPLALESAEIKRPHSLSGVSAGGRVSSSAAAAAQPVVLVLSDEVAKRVASREMFKEMKAATKAKRRQAHLAKLQALGKYDPARPSVPDPERWLPKSQRSHNKKGRKFKNKFSGAQGTGSGAAKDMKSLDAAARAAEKEAGTAAKTSTAHLEVASSSEGKASRGGRRR